LRPPPAALAVLLCLAVSAPAARAEAAPDLPELTRLVIAGDDVRAATDPDSAGRSLWVSYDRKANRWSAPVAGPPPVLTHADSLASVRVFDGGLFDKFGGGTIALGDGMTLAKRDSGFALVRDADGVELGWPAITHEDIEDAGGKVRQGLPRDYPEERLRQLLDQGRLRNEPGPTVRDGDIRWFGLKGGFAGGSGQLGGLLSYNVATNSFKIHRPFHLVEASATRVFARNGEIWIGTARFGENAIEGITGLILFRPAKKEWRQFSRRNSRISGDLVWDIGQDSNALWVTTDRGVSRYGFDSKNWSSWYWRPVKGGTGYALSSKPPGDLVEELVR
jgi:hypothetical protein